MTERIRCTIDPCENRACVTVTWPGAGLAHVCAAHLGSLIAEHGGALTPYTLGANPRTDDSWQDGRE